MPRVRISQVVEPAAWEACTPAAASTRKAKRPRKHAALKRAVAEGKQADRDFYRANPCRRHFCRPISTTELRGLLEQQGVAPLPGINFPIIYALMTSQLRQDGREIVRRVREVERGMWKFMVRNASCGRYLGFHSPEENAAKWFESEGAHFILGDTIFAERGHYNRGTAA